MNKEYDIRKGSRVLNKKGVSAEQSLILNEQEVKEMKKMTQLKKE